MYCLGASTRQPSASFWHSAYENRPTVPWKKLGNRATSATESESFTS